MKANTLALRSHYTLISLPQIGQTLLSLRARQQLQSADVILIEDDRKDEIFDLLEQNQLIYLLSRIKVLKTHESALLDPEIRELLDSHLNLARIVWERDVIPLAVRKELQWLRTLGYPVSFVPSSKTITREAVRLRLPWLKSKRLTRMRILDRWEIQASPDFWPKIVEASTSLALHFEHEELLAFFSRAMAEGADTYRAVALVSHHPLFPPQCWLSSLGEIHELLTQWDTEGTTLVYIEPDRKALTRLLHTP